MTRDENILMHRSEREALKSDLECQWQSHMHPSEGAKKPLAHATRYCKNSNQSSESPRIRTLTHTVTFAGRSRSAIVTSLDEI